MGGEFNSNKGMKVVVGLQSLFHYSQVKCNVVQQASLKSHSTNNMDSSSSCCYLKSCCLCSKNLRLDKEVYMYRGDQGFCSIECRDRQIYLDEMKEIEESSMRRRQCKSQLSETRLLLEEMRHRRTALHQKRFLVSSYN